MLNCAICKTHCCGGGCLVGSPILMPFEISKFLTYANYTNGCFRLNRRPDGLCVFLDENKRCKIYDERPIECKLYPYILTYDEELKLVLHYGCPQKSEAPKPEIPQKVLELPKQFWEKFSQLPA